MPSATEVSCRRELELEIPADKVQKAVERTARDFARLARVPGFRPGKAPVALIRRRFADDIKNEVLQTLVPESLEQALNEQKLVPVTRPQVDKVDFQEAGPVKFRASFEVLPEIALGDYQNLDVEVERAEVTEADVAEALEAMRQRAATFVPVEGRPVQDGDYAVLKVLGTPAAGAAEPLRAENVLCHVGAEETLDAFNQNLRGAQAGEHKRFAVSYPDDYPDPKLAAKTYNYAIEIVALKEKRLPELNDEFVKDVNLPDAHTLGELREKVRGSLQAERDARQAEQARQKILDLLISRHEFPVPQALVEHQMDVRLERAVRSLAAQGVDPRAVNVDWVGLRRRQSDRAVADVRAELLLDRVAAAENIDVTDEEMEKEIAQLAERGGESATALRARLTKDGSLDRMKSKLRSDKTLDWLYQKARIHASASAKPTGGDPGSSTHLIPR